MMNGESRRKFNERRDAVRARVAELAESKKQEKVKKKIVRAQKDFAVASLKLQMNDKKVRKILNTTKSVKCSNPAYANEIPPTMMNSQMCDHCHFLVCANHECITNLQVEHIPNCAVAKREDRKAESVKILTDLGALLQDVAPQLEF